MTIKEIEQATGLPRASVRFYESEGFISPTRGENGYRNYSQSDLDALLKGLAEKVQELGKEYITIYYGQDVTEETAQKAADIFGEVCPDGDINLLSGGQPVYYYLISAE